MATCSTACSVIIDSRNSNTALLAPGYLRTIVTGLSVARERETGTFDQLLVTPMGPVEILIGKSIPGIVIGLIEGTFILFFAVAP